MGSGVFVCKRCVMFSCIVFKQHSPHPYGCFVHVSLEPFCLVYHPMPPARYFARRSPWNERFELKLPEAIVPSNLTARLAQPSKA
jgi:hypothetical protein